MRIKLQPDVAVRLLAYSLATRMEFSGFGFATVVDGDLEVYDFVLLNVGSESYTEIKPEKILALLDRPDAKNLKVWIHKHPIGSGIPGPENWSMMDEESCTKQPLGSSPDIVPWSAAVVITPRGWVGRVDNHKQKRTIHCEVMPHIKDMEDEIRAIATFPQPALPRIDTIWNFDKDKTEIVSEYEEVLEEFMTEFGCRATLSEVYASFTGMSDEQIEEEFGW